MYIIFAFLSAFFAGVTSILAKCGIKKTDSTLATAIRTVVVVIFSWAMVVIVGSYNEILHIDGKTLLFLVLSGIATGASWLCYFKALQLGDINKVVPIDKSSTVLTIILAFVFLKEQTSLWGIVGIALMFIGTLMMVVVKGKKSCEKKGKSWIFWAIGSAVFASLTSLLAKVGIAQVESNLGTAIRTVIVLIMAWLMVIITGKQKETKYIDKKELLFICLSGIATGCSWLCYYKALQDGPASIVVPIDKLSIFVTVAFSFLVFKEKLKPMSFVGLVLIFGGTLLMLL